ncbi:unnamed protein product, partial [Amoebophrya sp. A120]
MELDNVEANSAVFEVVDLLRSWLDGLSVEQEMICCEGNFVIDSETWEPQGKIRSKLLEMDRDGITGQWINPRIICDAMNNNLKLLKRLNTILQSLNRGSLVQAAERIGAHARALLYLEQGVFERMLPENDDLVAASQGGAYSQDNYTQSRSAKKERQKLWSKASAAAAKILPNQGGASSPDDFYDNAAGAADKPALDDKEEKYLKKFAD